MGIKSVVAVSLLGAALAGCGGGSAPAAPATDPSAAIEETGAPAKAVAPVAKPVRKIDESMIPQPGIPIPRESYAYVGGGRDPFASVLESDNTGPEFPDLDLVAIYYQERAPASSVVVLRDRLTGKRYTVREGQRLGRMRISSIRSKDVTFAIDDYGTERQESLTVRKPEGNSP